MRTLQSAFYFPLSAHSKVLRFSPASSPTVTEHIRHSSSYLNEGTLNSDLVVLLAALLCALICALGLNSLFKCSLRCSRRMVLHSSDNEVAISLANTRLKKEAMKALPIIVYTATSHPPDVSTDCPICLAEFVDGEMLRLTPMCNHSFHVECIDQWLFSHSSCPVCRHCLNLHGENKKPGSAVINEATESNNTIHIVID